MKFAAAAVLLLICSSFLVGADWDHTITVDSSSPSTSLNEALKKLEHNSTVIRFSDGLITYALKGGSETSLHYKSGIAFIGPAIIQCVQQSNGGLSFAWSTDILLQNITLINCNMEHNSTSRNFSSTSFQFMTIKASMYFLFCSNVTLDSVTIGGGGGEGYGLILYNTIGTNTITNSLFISNGGYPLPTGGGVVIEFTYCSPTDAASNCPSQGHSLIDASLVSNAVYSISENIFQDNTASPSSFTNLDPYPSQGRNYFGLGRGGGLSCVFKGNALNNTINMNSNTFEGNVAQFGGSLYVAFDDNAHDNRVISHFDTISDSRALVPDSALTFVPPVAEGGGALFLYGSEKNMISLQSVTISDNVGSSFGGALSVKSMISRTVDDPGTLVLDEVQMERNFAQQGAGIYFMNMYPQSTPVSVNLSNCDWNYNSVDESCHSYSNVRCSGIVYTRMLPLVFSGSSTRFLMNVGSGLDIHQTTVTFFSNVVTFTSNTADNGAAIHVRNCGKVVVSHDINLFFGGNQAYFSGGAIYETGCTHTTLSYAGVGASQCFIQYLDSSVHPDNWNTSFFFDDNIAGKVSNALYSDSLLPCAWTDGSPLLTETDIKNTFCWKRWSYNGEICQSVIQSGPAYINLAMDEPVLLSSPGEPLLLSLKAYNNYDMEQAEEVKICLESKFGSLHNRPTDAPDCITAWTATPVSVTLFAKSSYYVQHCGQFDGQSAILSISTVNPPSPKILAPVSFNKCPSFAYFSCPECYLNLKDDIGLKCVDTNSCQVSQSPCTLNSSLTIVSGYCWNVDNQTITGDSNSSILASLTGGNCPYSYGKNLPCVSMTNFTPPLAESTTLCPANREGRLCGRCAPGYGLTTNTIDFRCIDCYGPGWPLQLALEIIIITFLIVLIVSLSISLNAGGTNAFIFFAQVVTVKYPGVSYPSWVFEPDSASLQFNNTIVRGFTLLYSIANFDIITPLPLQPFCLSESFSPLQAIMLDFISGFYPLLLLAILYAWVILYSYRFKPVYAVTRAAIKLCRCQRIHYRLSLLDSFATISIICFSRITATCFKLLTPTFYYSLSGDWIGTASYYDGTLDYFGPGHLLYALISLAVLLLMVLLPATLLLFSQCIQRFVSKRQARPMTRFQALTGTFNSCFKDGSGEGMPDFRFFAGVYLYMRIFIRLFHMLHSARLLLAIETVFSITVAVVFISMRPYKNDIYNTIDAIIFLYLALMAGVSAAGYAFVFYKGLLYLPLLIVLGYGVFHLLRQCVARVRASRLKYRYRSLPTIPDDDTSSSDDDEERPGTDMPTFSDTNDTERMFADRLLHPERYTRETYS